MIGGDDGDDAWDFFVSYTQTDRAWAEWISWVLEEAGFRVLVQAWDFPPGSNWVAGMDKGVSHAARTIAVLSAEYKRSVYGKAEWQAAWAADPDGADRKLLIARVVDCERPGLLGLVVSFDLFDQAEPQARGTLLRAARLAMSGQRGKPESAPAFPPDLRTVPARPTFPGATGEPVNPAPLDRPHGAPTGPWRRPWMAPPLDRTVERPGPGERLLAAITDPAGAGNGVTLTTALQGAGGFGKTRLATWLAHQPAVRERYTGGLLWATVGQERHGPDLADLLNGLVYELCEHQPGLSDPEQAGTELGMRLNELSEAVLLIVDDVWTPDQLAPFRRAAVGPTVTLLLTTRIADLAPAAGLSIPVDEMTSYEALDLALHPLPTPDRSALPPSTVGRLLERTGGWALLLNLVAGQLTMLLDHGRPAADAIAYVVDRLEHDGPQAFDNTSSRDRTLAAAACIAASLDLLSADERNAFHDLAIFPEDEPVPLSVLRLLRPGVDRDVDQLHRVGLLAAYRHDPPEPRLLLHDVIRDWLTRTQSEDERAEIHRRLLNGVRSLIADAHGAPPGSEKPENGLGNPPTPWWTLPADLPYLWRQLPQHLAGAGDRDSLLRLITDLRWTNGSIEATGSALAVEAAALAVDDPQTRALGRRLGQISNLLAADDPPPLRTATLVSRLQDLPALASAVAAYLHTLPRTTLQSCWSLPDMPDAALELVFTGHTDSIYAVAFSPDGTRLATASDDGTVRLWDPATRRAGQLDSHAGPVYGVYGVAFSPDSTYLATAGTDGTVRLWDPATRRQTGQLSGHTGPVNAVAFSPDGARLATGSNDQTVRLWDPATGQETAQLSGHTGWVNAVAFSPDGARLATGSNDQTVRLWDPATGQETAQLSSHTDRLNAVAFSSDGTRLATASDDGTVRIWDPATGQETGALDGHIGPVNTVAFSPDDALLATAGTAITDRMVRIWNPTTHRQTGQLDGHTGGVNALAFSPDGTRLATAGTDRTVRVWNPTTGYQTHQIDGHSQRVNAAAFSPDGTRVATAGDDGTVRIWDRATGRQTGQLDGHTDWVNAAAFSPDGTDLATASNDRTVRIWDSTTLRQKGQLDGHNGPVNGIAFSPDGTRLATASDDGTVRIWNPATRRLTGQLDGQIAGVNAVAFSPDGTRLATASDDGTVRIWDPATRRQTAELDGHAGGVNAVAFSPRGNRLATASNDRTVRIWDPVTGRQTAQLDDHTDRVNAVAFSPQGTYLAAASSDRTVRIWNPTTLETGVRCTDVLTAIAWSPGGTCLAVTGAQGVYMFAFMQERHV